MVLIRRPLNFYNFRIYFSHCNVFPVGNSSKQLPSVNVTGSKLESTLDYLTKTRAIYSSADKADLSAGSGN